MSGIGGNCISRPTVVSSSGAESTHSRHAPSTSAARSIGKKSAPA